MSRIGKKPVPIPAGVNVTIEGDRVTAKGPKGELTRRFDPTITIRNDDGALVVERPSDGRLDRALHGLVRALLNNMIVGVSEGFEKQLAIVGTGYRGELEGPSLKLTLGFSHDILVMPPEGISFEVEDRGRLIIIRGYDKELVGQLAADIRKLRPPEPYKGKGIRYVDEHVRQKAGKAGKAAA